MKLIEKKEQKKVPELIWGAKYLLLSYSDELDKGDTVILATTTVDSDGEVRVFSEEEWDYVKPEQLQLITEETAEKAEPTYVIEFTESELKMVYASVGISNNVNRKELLVKNQIDLGSIKDSFDDAKLYQELQKTVKGGDK